MAAKCLNAFDSIVNVHIGPYLPHLNVVLMRARLFTKCISPWTAYVLCQSRDGDAMFCQRPQPLAMEHVV